MILDWIVFTLLLLSVSVSAGAIIFFGFVIKTLVAITEWIIDL